MSEPSSSRKRQRVSLAILDGLSLPPGGPPEDFITRYMKPYVVQDVSGYNSWPMVQAIGDKLVCVYGRDRKSVV